MKDKRKSYRHIFVFLTAFVLLLSSMGAAACNAGKNNELEYIVLNTDEVQKTFELNDEFNYDGLVVTAHYADGTSGEVSDYMVKAPDTSEAGVKEVVVKYGGVKSQYSITVNAEAARESYEIGAPIVKYVYDETAVTVEGATEVDGNALKFKAEAADGYSVAKVTAKVDGTEVAVEGENGEYSVSAEALTGNTVITVAAQNEKYVEAEYKVNYYSQNGDLLAVYGYDSGDEELYQPAEQKYCSFNGWTDENGNKVETLSADMRGVNPVALTAETEISAAAVSEGIGLNLESAENAVEATITIDREIGGGDISIAAIGLVLAKEDISDISFIDYADKLDGKAAPWESETEDKVNWENVRLGRLANTGDDGTATAFAYGYKWGDRYGSLTVKFNIKADNFANRHFKAWLITDGGDICGQPDSATPGLSYELEKKWDSQTVANPGVWTYSAPDNAKFVSMPAYSNGTITVDIASKVNSEEYIVRYQPTFALGTEYTAEFTVKFETDDPNPYIVFGQKYYNSKDYGDKKVNGDGSITITYQGTVLGTEPFRIRINTSNDGNSYAIKATISNILFTAKDPNVYNLDKANNAQTVANPGVWTYSAPDNAKFVSAPKYDNGTVTMDIESKIKADEYYVRYQPDFAVGTEYTVVFTVKLETEDPSPYIVFGAEFNSSLYYQNKKVNTDGSFTITYTSTVTDKPFQIRVNTSSDTTPYAIKMTLTGITFTAKQTQPVDPVEPDEPDDAVYNLAKGGNAATVAAPGVWTYWTSSAENFNEAPSYNKGKVTMDISHRIKSETYRISYQPTFSVGTKYTLKFTINFETEDETVYFTFGKEYNSSKNYSNLVKNQDGSITVKYTGTVDASAPFLIQVATDSVEIPVAVKMTVYDISFTAN